MAFDHPQSAMMASKKSGDDTFGDGFMNEQEMQLIQKLDEIFSPELRRQRNELYPKDPDTGIVCASAKFVHYTSAEAALSIIGTACLWMRNARCMSDYREVEHGFDIWKRFLQDTNRRETFTSTLDDCIENGATDALGFFYEKWQSIHSQTYITSMSVHDASEDLHGRLSMWRGFGGGLGRVGLVFKIPWGEIGAEQLGLMFTPVSYLSDERALDNIQAILASIFEKRDFLKSQNPNLLRAFVQSMIPAGVTCMKHEGFKEEREWRAIYVPEITSPNYKMNSATKVIGGVPQLVHLLPLDGGKSINGGTPELAGLEFAKLFDRLIIGPSQYSLPMKEAFVSALVKAGIAEETARQNVLISGIPLRA